MKMIQPRRHPHAYEWHDPHTDHYRPVVVAHEAPSPVNEQAAGVGSPDYERFAKHYGVIKPGTKGPTSIYPYHGKLKDAQTLVGDQGYEVYYAGGKYGRPDLANKNYNTKHLMVYDPTPGSGGDFQDRDYTDTWRQVAGRRLDGKPKRPPCLLMPPPKPGSSWALRRPKPPKRTSDAGTRNSPSSTTPTVEAMSNPSTS